MNKTLRKALVAAAALLAVAVVPISTATQDHAWGGFGEWPVSAKLNAKVK